MASLAVSLPRTITSAGGVISQLEEQDASLKAEALLQLDATVDHFWPELAENLEIIEALAEDSNFIAQKRACLVLSKVNYHLELYDQALDFALGAGELFKLSDRTEYVEKMVTKCIDKYITYKNALDKRTMDGGHSAAIEEDELDPRLLDIVERMFNRCKADKEWYHGLGIAIECKRLDKVEDFVCSSPFLFDMIDYCQRNLRNPAIGSREFRMNLVRLLIDIYKKQGLNKGSKSSASSGHNKVKFITKLLQCYCFANDVKSSKELLAMLIQREITLQETGEDASLRSSMVDVGAGADAAGGEKPSSDTRNLLLVFQLAFDIVENENQQFCRELVQILTADKDMIVGKKPEPAPEDAGEKKEGEQVQADGDAAMTSADAAPPSKSYPPFNSARDEEFQLLIGILSGLTKLKLNLDFLFKNNRTDLLILDKAKKSCDTKAAMLHTGHMFMHGFMQAGTSSDIYLRQNLEWMGRAVMWAKFSATASLGVVHRGHIKESRNLLSSYLPREGQQGASLYAEGGALYAMGLVHGNYYDASVESYLLEQLKQGAHSEILRHGACLGLGLSSMGTHNPAIVDEMKQALYTDNAITGEAAAYGMGLVLCGSASEKDIKELVQYAQDTQHEKIIRGCAIALAMIMFQKEESADSLVEQLLLEKDPILRYGGCFVIAMAYCGTASTRSIQKLLHLAVSDVHDDVRRAAVLGLGFVMCNVPQRVPTMVKLLANSYNPHVRYAAAMTLGISGAGSANAEAEEILRPLLTDSTDFVRQGAYIAMGLLYMQSVTESAEKFRADVMKCIGEKHEDVVTRFGALLAQGILDAGGRNVCASFFSKSGAVRQGAGVGFLLFTQMWYWYPLIHGLSLSFVPTALIGLNKDLRVPKSFSFHSDVREAPKSVKQNHFDYPAAEETKKTEETVKTKAVLSTAAKKTGAKSGMERTSSKTPVEGGGDKGSSLLPPAEDGASGKKESSENKKGKVPSKDADPAALESMKKKFDAMDVDDEGDGGKKKDDAASASAVAAGEKKKAGATASEADGAGKEKDRDKDKAGKDKDKDGTGEAKKKKLPALMELANPSRVIPIQEKYVRFNLNDTLTAGQALRARVAGASSPGGGAAAAGAAGAADAGATAMEVDGENENESTAADLETRKATPCRYVPLLRGDRPSGFLLLEDRNPNEPEEFVEPSKKMEDPEPEPPEPFEWIDGVDG